MLRQQAAATASVVLQRSRIASAPKPHIVPSVAAPTSSTPIPLSRPLINMSSSPDVPEHLRQQKPSRQGPTTYFPLGYKDAAYQWWTSVTPQIAERNVLSFMPYLKESVSSLTATTPSAAPNKHDPYGTRTWRQSLVQLSGKNRALNEICIAREGEEVEETLVMVHGYGAGLGFFFKNFEPITRIPGLKLYALDMLGMGNSSRPPFKIHARDKEEKVQEAENWFIDALEEWRKARKIERFTLLGHSLGGYLAVSYAIKYPGHLKKLILASPVGIPEDPYAVNSSLPEPEESTVQNEFTQDQLAATEGHTNMPAKTPHEVAANGQPNAPKRPLPSWLVWLWDANISPFSIVRLAGPFGPRFVSGWSSRRFNHLPPDEAQALHDYSFSIFKQKGSGEYALAYILAPGAYARRPVINRIQHVGRQAIPQPDGSKPIKETGIPIVFMYGENDWMDVAGGLASEEKIKQAKIQALLEGTDEEKRNENGSVRVVVIPKAGHHLYLDNPDKFNEVLKEEMEETKKAGR